MAEVSDDDFLTAALRPKRSKSAEKEMDERGIDELIKAADYLNRRNRTRKLFSVRTLSPPGTQ